MIRTINRADRLVGLVLASLEAGACVSEMGQTFWQGRAADAGAVPTSWVNGEVHR